MKFRYHKRKLWVKGMAVLLLSFLLACNGDNGNGDGSEPSDVVDFQTSPDGDFVAYIADQYRDEVFELFVVELATRTVTQISGTLVSGGDVLEFKWAPDSSRIAYLADEEANDVIELFTKKPDGSDKQKPAGNLGPLRDVIDFAWSPDSLRIAYLADQDIDDVFDLYSAIPAITPPFSGTKLSSGLVPGREIIDFAWAPDPLQPFNNRIAFLADKVLDGVYELYTVLSNGSGEVLVSSNFFDIGQKVETFAWAPDNSKIAFRADQEVGKDIIELFTTDPLTPVNVIKVSANPLVDGGNVGKFAWAPDSSRIAYIADQENDNIFELFTVLPDGTSNKKVSEDLDTNEEVLEFAWAFDSSTVAYLADPERDSVYELFTADPDPIAGPDFTRVSLALGVDQSVEDFVWSPDSFQVAYRADQATPDIIELFTVEPDGSNNRKVSGSLGPDQNVEELKWAPDSSRIAYRADQDSNDVFELYTTNPLAVSDFVKVSGAMVAGGNVEEFEWDPTLNSSFLIYRADQDTLDVFELYNTRPDNNTNVIKISGPF
ncbi:MAG: PD40 domain-containing protein [Deltaproteobacteria bacterium]|nr:MAG: PD40 domain-containing protein [Deltaproteobacteria bacterium]